MMALTDLTGTTWTLNSSLTSYADGWPSTKTYSVNITTAEQLPDTYGDYSDSFVNLSIGYDGGDEYNRVAFSTSSSGYPPTIVASGNDTKTLPDTWRSGYYEGTFTVTGGTDATNSTLIAWMEDNCTQYVPPTPDVVVTYEGANIVELSEAGTKTLKTAGKYLTDDVVLAYSGGSGGGGGVETTSVVVCKPSGLGYGSVYYTDENMEPQNAHGVVRALMPIGSIVVANDSTPAEPGPTAQRAGITQLFSYPSRSSVIYAFKVTG